MRPEILKILTIDDIVEIIDTYYLVGNLDDIIPALLERNGCPPSIGLRFPVVMSAAEQATGRKLSKERSKENTIFRSFVAYKLREEGYTFSDIGKMLQRDHSTVVHLRDIMRDMLSVPNAYREEINMFREFEELLCQTKNS